MSESKKILILGAGEGQVPLILRAKEAGWYTVVVSPQGHYPGFELADRCCYLDISDAEAILGLAREMQVKAIATDQTDISMPTVVTVAKELGLPCIDCENIYHFQFKSLMREICYRQGIATIVYCVTDKLEEAQAFFLSIPNGKAIVKPVDSQGSRGIHKVCSSDGIPDAFASALKYSRSGRVIIEQFIDGHEIEVDTAMKDGKTVCTLIGDVYNFGFEDTFSAYERIYPARMEPELEKTVRAYNESVLKALGLTTGWTHGEYIVTEEGDVYLLEVGLRGGGNFIGSDILRDRIGVGTDEMAFLTATGDDSFYERMGPGEGHCAYKCFYLPEGEVKTVDIDEGLLNRPFVLRHNLDGRCVGRQISKATDKTSRYTVVVKAETTDELRSILDDIENRIHVGVLTASGMQGAIWK